MPGKTRCGLIPGMPYLFACIILFATLSACDRTARDPNGTPLLHHAAESGDLSGIDTLLSEGSPVNVRDWCQRTPLMLAAQHGRTKAVQHLLDKGAFVDLHEKGNYTALLLAASRGHSDTLRLLAAQGANLDEIEHTHGWTALIWAAKEGYADAVATLLSLGANPGLRDSQGRSALDWAQLNGNPLTIAHLQSVVPR